MHKDQQIEQCSSAYTRIVSLSAQLAKHINPMAPWRGQSTEDFILALKDLVAVLAPVFEHKLLPKLSSAIIAKLCKELTQVANHLPPLTTNASQIQFETTFSHLETLRAHIQTWGLHLESTLATDLFARTRSVDKLLQNTQSAQRDLIKITQELKGLKGDAAIKSISDSFIKRQANLSAKNKLWVYAFLAMAALSLLVTTWMWDFLPGAMINSALDLTPSSDRLDSKPFWQISVIRLSILLPIYTFTMLCFVQYKKERSLEEEYAHRAAVGKSLLHYKDLASDNHTKDRILSEASKVIFSPPQINGETQTEKHTYSQNPLYEILDEIRKLNEKNL